MIPELGVVFSIFAMLFSLRGGLALLCRPHREAFSRVWPVLLLVVGAGMALLYSLYLPDFSVSYVYAHTNTDLPLAYRLSAFWGGHEGSVLFWNLLLILWTAYAAKRFPSADHRETGILLMIQSAFLGFMLFTSNPFARMLPLVPESGQSLNPLLQDPGLVIHPPMLYVGYVGTVVLFAYALAALSRTHQDWRLWGHQIGQLVRWPLAFLTLGITLGSWWAYYELGWGGWWFWDPVENASLMPWFAMCALLHSAQLNRQGQAYGLSVTLSVLGFSLSLLGTFLVRSGVLNSVHAFASDPKRGQFLLLMWFSLMIITAGSFGKVSRHWPKRNLKKLWSIQGILWVNALLLLSACLTTLLGTIYPLIFDAMNLGKIAVGPPYFNTVVLPQLIPLVLLAGFAFSLQLNFRQLIIAVLMSVASLKYVPIFAAVSIGLASYLLLTTMKHLIDPVGARGAGIAHLGLAVLCLGISLTSHLSETQTIAMKSGETIRFADLSLTIRTIDRIRGPNYLSQAAVIEVVDRHNHAQIMKPEKRFFPASNITTTETALAPGFFRDIYVAMGEPLGEDAWSIRVANKPFVRWLWLGGLLMTLGIVVSALKPVLFRKALQVSSAEKPAS